MSVSIIFAWCKSSISKKCGCSKQNNLEEHCCAFATEFRTQWWIIAWLHAENAEVPPGGISNGRWLIREYANNGRHWESSISLVGSLLVPKAVHPLSSTIVHLYSQRRIMVAPRDGKDKSLNMDPFAPASGAVTAPVLDSSRDVTNYSCVMVRRWRWRDRG